MQAIAIVDSLILLGIAAFQVSLAAGKPWGEYSWGGAHRGTLPVRLRRSSAISALVLTGASFVALIEGEVVAADMESVATEIIIWALVALLFVGIIMNGVSRSKKERNLWTPVNAVACALTAAVAAFS